jgi:GntR family transcriptional activator of glc operon
MGGWSDQLISVMQEKPIPMSRAVAYRLEQLILDGSLAPEQMIPSERQLASRFGVSRAIVREALHELQGRGIIRTQHGKGSFVSHMVPEPEGNGPLMQMFMEHSRTLYDLFDVRQELEGKAAYLAAERATEKDQYQITKAFEAMEKADPLTNADLDHAFHRAIVNACHNPVLIHVLNSLKDLMLNSVQASVANLSHRDAFKQQIDKHHRQIYHSVISRQSKWAQKAAMAHVAHVAEALRAIETQEHGLIRASITPSAFRQT